MNAPHSPTPAGNPTRDDVHSAAAAATRPETGAVGGVAAATGEEDAARHDAVAAARILLADGDEIAVAMLKAFLAESGYASFVTATDLATVHDLIASERPDAVLLSATPEPSTWQVLARIRDDPDTRHTPVIVLAESGEVESRLAALRLGAADFLAKPVDPRELLLRLANVLAAKAHLDQHLYRDALTGLPNRARFTDQLDWALRFAKRYGTVGAVLQIGIDRFKQINEALGPAIGDRLLRAVAQRLASSLRDTDLVARETDPGPALLSRMGGDEFMVLLPAIDGAEGATAAAQRILDVVSEPFTLAGRELVTTCSVGVAVFPGDGGGRDAILKAASVAMRHAKADRRGSLRFFSRELNEKSLHRLSMEGELRKAIDHDELELHFQPKVDLKTGRMCGAEALVRWRHPQRGMVSPGDFIPLAEECGLIVPLGLWVLRHACRHVQSWHRAGIRPPRVSVNVSTHQLRHRDLPRQLQAALADHRVAPADLCLELTESAVMEQAVDGVHTLDMLHDSGVTLAIDDFGTGYSSLSRLKRLPIDEIKIDRSFVTDVERDRDSAAIVTAVIAMARSLELRVVAEGVETPGQLGFLVQRGCDECQGFLFSRPLPASEFGALLRAGELPVIAPVPTVAGT